MADNLYHADLDSDTDAAVRAPNVFVVIILDAIDIAAQKPT